MSPNEAMRPGYEAFRRIRADRVRKALRGIGLWGACACFGAPAFAMEAVHASERLVCVSIVGHGGAGCGFADDRSGEASDRVRGIRVRPVASGSGGLTILPADEPQDGVSQGLAQPTPMKLKAADEPGLRKIAVGPIRIASLDGQSAWFPSLQRQRPVVLVDARANPDLTWDPKSREVLVGPDVVARDVSAADLPGVVDQALALAWLKQQSGRASQPMKLLSGDELLTRDTRIEVQVEQLTGKYLVLFNLSGTGATQLLYPLGSDPPQRPDATYSVVFQVREPFGADHIVAVTSARPMPELEKILRESARRLNPDRLASALERNDARIGYVRIFTTP